MLPALGVLFDGVAYGMLLFLMSVGLSVTLGMMNFVNLAHCSFAMLGGYVTVTLMNAAGWPFLATLPAAFVAGAAASIVLERIFFRRFYNSNELNQCLLTIGIVFVSIATAAYIYGTDQQPMQLPSYLRGSYHVAGHRPRRLPAVSDRGGGADHGRTHGDPGIDPLRRAGPRRGEQSAHGARSRHRRRPAVCLYLCAGRRPGGARRRHLPFRCWDSTRHSR